MTLPMSDKESLKHVSRATLERALRVALRPVDPPAGFVPRVLSLALGLTNKGDFVKAPILALCLIHGCVSLSAQTRHFVRGTVSSVSSTQLEIRDDEGKLDIVGIPVDVKVQELTSGHTDLQSAVPANATDISSGDRVVIAVNDQPSGPALASKIILMKATDAEKARAMSTDDWSHGVQGFVEAVHPESKTVTIKRQETEAITVHLDDKAQLLRYASDSVKFADAKPSSLDAIHTGDQFQARGTLAPDRRSFSAIEVIYGSFRNISGRVMSVSSTMDSLTIQDAISHSIQSVALTPNTQIRKLTPAEAKAFLSRVDAASAATQPSGSSDLTKLFSTLTPLTPKQLRVGDQVFIAEAGSAPAITAISILGGVGPILDRLGSDTAINLEPWNLSSGGPQ